MPSPRADSALAVEDRLYSALAIVRVVVTVNMVGLNAYRRDNFSHPDLGLAVVLALETGAPVIPCAVVGTDVVAPAGKVYGTWTRPVVRFGKPLDFSRYAGMENDRYILRSITDEIMYEIMRLSGQEYVDMYASRAKEESKKASPEPDPAPDAEESAEPKLAS